MFQKNPFLKKSYRFNRPKKKDNPEGHLVMQIIYYLRAKGYACGKTKTTGAFHKRENRFLWDPYLFKGFPDITAFTPSLIFIECKSTNGRQAEEQKNFQKLCEEAGIKYILARRLEDVSEVIK